MFFCFFLKTECHYDAKASLQLSIFVVCQYLKCWIIGWPGLCRLLSYFKECYQVLESLLSRKEVDAVSTFLEGIFLFGEVVKQLPLTEVAFNQFKHGLYFPPLTAEAAHEDSTHSFLTLRESMVFEVPNLLCLTAGHSKS